MNKTTDLYKTVEDLRASQKEGVYWDFKQQHHTNKDKLLHDILCLANSKHEGDRYLIYGITDNFNYSCVAKNDSRRTQADISNFLISNQQKFSNEQFPDVRLEKLEINNCNVDVLIIKDQPFKPYYLIENYNTTLANHIYSRINDSNTPRDKSAPHWEIERMWRERFGLGLSPLKRFHIYLQDFEGWTCNVLDNGNSHYHYKDKPEFTIRVEDAEGSQSCNDEWTRGEVRTDNNSTSYFSIYYHQTRLAKIQYVSFDDYKKIIIAPDYRPRNSGRFFFYEEGSLRHLMQEFLIKERTENFSVGLMKGKINIPILTDKQLDLFLIETESSGFLEPNTIPKEQNEIFIQNTKDFYEWTRSVENIKIDDDNRE